MQRISFFSLLVLIFSSCGPNVSFVNPQPVFLDSVEEFPLDYQGEFVDVSILAKEEEKIIVTPNTISVNIDNEIVVFDSLVIKPHGNYLYINVLNDEGYYELYVARIVRYLSNENIQVMTVQAEQDELSLFNMIDTYTRDGFLQEKMYVLDDLNVNQLNLYRNMGIDVAPARKRFSSEYKRVK